MAIAYSKHKSAIWITWENQRRNREISRRLGIPLLEFAHIDAIKNPIHKYAKGIFITFAALNRLKPSIIFAQNPSLVLCLFLAIYKSIAKCKLIVDAHNAGIFPKEGRSRLLLALSRIVQRQADLTIVTNPALANHVKGVGGQPFVLPDPIPDLPSTSRKELEGDAALLFICTYAADEPYQAVFEAAKRIPKKVFIYVTGNYQKHDIDPSGLPPNLILTGYVPEDDYIAMLHSVDGTIDLTTRENCLVCGAYESVAAGKPMILSDTKDLRTYFDKGAVYTDNTVSDLCRCIEELVDRKDELTQDIVKLGEKRASEWESRAADLSVRIFGNTTNNA